jgi:outer membrane protein TolC
VVFSKYEIGKTSQADLMRLTLMKNKLLDDFEDYEQKEKELQAVLNSVLNRDLNTFINTTSIEKNLFIEFNFEELLEVSKQKRPLLKKIKESSKMKRLTLSQVKWERLPDITLWTGYRYRKDTELMKNDDFFSIGLSLPLPFDFKGRTKAKINNAEFMENASEQNYQNVLNNISEMLLTTISKLERTSNKVNNYNDKLIPDAEKTLSSILSSYKTGRANFTDLYQAQLQLIQFEKILIKSKYQYAIYESTIETLSGENLMEN